MYLIHVLVGFIIPFTTLGVDVPLDTTRSRLDGHDPETQSRWTTTRTQLKRTMDTGPLTPFLLSTLD